MPVSTSTRLHIDPPIDQWQVTPRNGRAKPVIATGHQPTLWHPGILAKDLAADALANRLGGSALHVVVEHNPLDPLAIEVPVRTGSALHTHRIAIERPGVGSALPPNRTPSIASGVVSQILSQQMDALALPRVVEQGLGRLVDAWDGLSDQPNLADQVTAVLVAMKRPYLHQPMATLKTSRLVTPRFVERLLTDPVGCVRCYNRAVIAYPQSGIRRLYAGRDVVEVPLWAQGSGGSVPVYADLGDSKRPILFTQDQAIDLSRGDAVEMLRPRAITLSAIMRSEHCDLFIHGTGGGIYDQVTERWWHDWTGEDLAPKAVVTADVFLPLDVPTATPAEHAKAQWFAHHLPHNIDRYSETNDRDEAALRNEKHQLLDRMNDDRDKRRRAKAFKRIHAINAELGERHREVLNRARQRVTATSVGFANGEIAARRDWSFALYSEAQLKALSQAIEGRLTRTAHR